MVEASQLSPQDVAEALSPERYQALMALLEARLLAQETGCDPWEFALQLLSLARSNVSDSVLRWLVVRGYAEHRLEDPTPFPGPRRFLSPGPLRLLETSCFLLTPRGFLLAQNLRATLVGPSALPNDCHTSASPIAVQLPDDADVGFTSLKPYFDTRSRTLWVGEEIVKQFRVPAGNQELILSAFQEEDWPDQVDDPLPPAPGLEPKRRLHDAIHRLNRNQKKRLVRFRGTALGRAILWSWGA